MQGISGMPLHAMHALHAMLTGSPHAGSGLNSSQEK
jgi:hypothetical protein